MEVKASAMGLRMMPALNLFAAHAMTREVMRRKMIFVADHHGPWPASCYVALGSHDVHRGK
jgi:hypothetical protein